MLQPQQAHDLPACAFATITGPFRVTLTDTKQDATPNGTLRRAFLAVLLTGPNQTRSRGFLREMFWGDKPPKKSSASLRNIVQSLRQELAQIGEDTIVSWSDEIQINPKRLRLLPPQPGRGVLEGLDLNLNAPECFEDWLRNLRMNICGAPIRDSGHDQQIGLAIMPPTGEGLCATSNRAVNAALDHLIQLLLQTICLDIFDFRDVEGMMQTHPVDPLMGPSHILQTVIRTQDERPCLSFRLIESSGRRLLDQSNAIPLTDAMPMHLAHYLDHLIGVMSSNRAGIPAKHLFPWLAVLNLFSLDKDRTRQTMQRVHDLAQNDPGGLFECIAAFGSVFHALEEVGTGYRLTLDHTMRLREGLLADPTRAGLGLSLLGYTLHMQDGDSDLAELLVEEAIRFAPGVALLHNHLAVVRLARDRFDEADYHARMACGLGAKSPISFTFENTRAMIALARGDHQSALLHTNRALLRKPRCLASLRIGMVCLSIAGRENDAQKMLRQLMAVGSELNMASWADSVRARFPGKYGKLMHQGMQKYTQ